MSTLRAALIGLIVSTSVLGTLAVAAAPTSQAVADTSTQPWPSFVSVVLNGQPVLDNTLVVRVGTRFFFSRDDHKTMRLLIADRGRNVIFDGTTWYEIGLSERVVVRFDDISQLLNIQAEPLAFESAAVTLNVTPPITPTRNALGAFASWDVIAQRGLRQSNGTLFAGQSEVGVFTPFGVFTQTLLGAHEPTRTTWARLDSVFTVDQPTRLASFRLGDTISHSATWGSPVRFGGFQYATNFATQPSLVTWPLNSISGLTSLPSLVDVYVNNVYSSTQAIPAGPFTLNNLPAINGQGEIRVVVRDALGREQAYAKPLYGSTTLLQPGLSDFAIQAGRLRDAYAIHSNRYTAGFLSGSFRHGWNERLTLESAAEFSARVSNAGVGASWLGGHWGEFSAAGSVSQQRVTSDSPNGGNVWSASWNRQSTLIGAGARLRLASDGFRDLASLGGLRPARRETLAYASYGAGFGTLAANFISQWRPGSERADIVQANYSKGLGDWGYLSLNLLTTLRGTPNRSISLNWSMPLDFSTLVGFTSAATRTDQTRLRENRINLQRSLPSGEGYGYRADLSDQNRLYLDLDAQDRSRRYSAAFNRQQGQDALRLGVAGSVILMDGDLFAGRRVEDAFALVQVPGFANVRVYADNLEVGRTNARGNLFVSRLRPWQQNRLSIEQLDLPISAEVGALTIPIVPYLKSGGVARFDVRESLGGMVRVLDQHGVPLPSGSLLTLQHSGASFPVVENGEAWISGLVADNTLVGSWNGKRCTMPLRYQRSDDPQPFLGTLSCDLQAP